MEPARCAFVFCASALVVGALALGCSAASNDADSLRGVVHVHQFDDSAHAFAAFVATPVPMSEVRGDELAALHFAVAAHAGDCALTRIPVCAPPCAGASYCDADNHCAPLPDRHYIDGGTIRITGAALAPMVTLQWNAAAQGYLSTPSPGASLITGGEELTFSDGESDVRFTGALRAPQPPTLQTPAGAPALAALATPDAAASPSELALAWRGAAAERIEVTLAATDAEGRSAYVQCDAVDQGALALPASLLGALPSPPRDLQLTVERSNDLLVPLPSGSAVLLHAAQTITETLHQPAP